MRTNGELVILAALAPHLDVVFDVGAFVGDWSSQLLSLNPRISRIHAFEPFGPSYATLVSRNSSKALIPHRVALSSQPGKRTLAIFGIEPQMNSLHDRQGLQDGWGIEPAHVGEEVLLDTIDAFRERHEIPAIDLLKIDAEGHDVFVLEGAQRSLEGGAIKRIQFEYGASYIDSRRLLKDVFSLFAPLPYEMFLIAPDRLMHCPRYDQRLENFQYKNFLVLHREVLVRTPMATTAMSAKRAGMRAAAEPTATGRRR
jgi:FkbM family methyltransferase